MFIYIKRSTDCSFSGSFIVIQWSIIIHKLNVHSMIIKVVNYYTQTQCPLYDQTQYNLLSSLHMLYDLVLRLLLYMMLAREITYHTDIFSPLWNPTDGNETYLCWFGMTRGSSPFKYAYSIALFCCKSWCCFQLLGQSYGV